MASSLHRIVENKELFRCAKECGLASYIFNQPFLVREWIPPGPIPDCLKSNEKRLQLGLVRKQRISWRTLADVVEAIVGIFTLQSNNMNEALKAISWLRIGINYLEFDITRVLIAPSASLSPCVINHLETGIGYHFKNVGLASMALHYDAQDPDGGLHFSRLAYLGDCILSHQVAKHLLTSYQTEKVGVINDMKQSIINKENMAFVCVKHELHMVLSGILGEVEEDIVAYVTAIEKIIKDRKPPSFGYAVSCAPKVWASSLNAYT
jgi:dsRNA-specific ribonuclease